MRLIDADVIMVDLNDDADYADMLIKDIKEYIAEQPTIDAEPVRHGRWIIKSNPENGWYKITCSECGEDETAVAPCIGFMPNVKVIWDFCPNCGARMDGGGKNAIS